MTMKISTIDLNFNDQKAEIATYLLRYAGGAVLVDPGPESTLPALVTALDQDGLTPGDVTHVLLTHIHLDHAGAAGWFAEKGAQIFVHPAGAMHMLNPEKLIASATRLYGDAMERLWGEMKPVPAARLVQLEDAAEIQAGTLRIRGLHTPGHAEHHISYLVEDLVFSGDVGGLRFKEHAYVRLPFVPPETNLKKWRASLVRMLETGCRRIAPTHYGVYEGADAHIKQAIHFLDVVEAWMERNMPAIPDVVTLKTRYADFQQAHEVAAGLDKEARAVYERGGPVDFAAAGLFRYWQKTRPVM
jgi:glyoxylase-like metal-dependent hydrolase (beta-lactamase superfamily II)